MARWTRSYFITALIAVILACFAIMLWLDILHNGDANTRRTIDNVVAVTSGGNPIAGRENIISFGCAACHEVAGIPGARGKIGPSLSDFKERQMIAGVMFNSSDNLIRWLQDPRAVDPKTAMPNLGLTQQQARDIAAYLYAGKAAGY